MLANAPGNHNDFKRRFCFLCGWKHLHDACFCRPGVTVRKQMSTDSILGPGNSRQPQIGVEQIVVNLFAEVCHWITPVRSGAHVVSVCIIQKPAFAIAECLPIVGSRVGHSLIGFSSVSFGGNSGQCDKFDVLWHLLWIF